MKMIAMASTAAATTATAPAATPPLMPDLVPDLVPVEAPEPAAPLVRITADTGETVMLPFASPRDVVPALPSETQMFQLPSGRVTVVSF